MKITDPQDVEITDQITEWAAKRWGVPDLPMLFLQEFKDHFAANGKRFSNAEQAFKNWINREAPGGQFHNAVRWEQRLERAKRMDPLARMCKAARRVAGQYVGENGKPTSEPPVVSVTAKQAMSHMLRNLAEKVEQA